MTEQRRLFLLRAVFLGVLGGGLLLWGEARRPRPLPLVIDLSAARPGELTEVDLVVRRGGRVLARHDLLYPSGGAPQTVDFEIRAAPGEAEVETTLVSSGKPARKSVAAVKLSEAPSRVTAE